MKTKDINVTQRFIINYNLVKNYSFVMLRFAKVNQSKYKDLSIQHHIINLLDSKSWRNFMEKYGYYSGER
jgi:hypothetical protein